uniref:Uncharacterized protein n=1 Tax=Anguilla anguilla TaxID=7936 RepID=A0A0E9XE17_ANGAN
MLIPGGSVLQYDVKSLYRLYCEGSGRWKNRHFC